MTLAYLQKIFGRHAYCSSEAMPFRGYRLIIGFDTLQQLQAAHQAIIDLGKALEARTQPNKDAKHGN